MAPPVPARPLLLAIVVVAALAAGGGVIALALASDHKDAQVAWAIFGPAIGWSFVGTGLYASRLRPQSRIGALMVLLGFAWFLFTLDAANSPPVYTFALVAGGLWGGVFLHLGMTFPSGRLRSRLERAIVIAGYLIFPLANLPPLFFAGPHELGCDECPTNVLLIRRDGDAADVASAVGAALYAGLFVIVLAWAIRRWRRTSRPCTRSPSCSAACGAACSSTSGSRSPAAASRTAPTARS